MHGTPNRCCSVVTTDLKRLLQTKPYGPGLPLLTEAAARRSLLRVVEEDNNLRSAFVSDLKRVLQTTLTPTGIEVATCTAFDIQTECESMGRNWRLENLFTPLRKQQKSRKHPFKIPEPGIVDLTKDGPPNSVIQRPTPFNSNLNITNGNDKSCTKALNTSSILQSKKRKADEPPPPHAELKSGYKRRLQDIPHGTLFSPQDVVSPSQYDQYERKKKEKQQQRRHNDSGKEGSCSRSSPRLPYDNDSAIGQILNNKSSKDTIVSKSSTLDRDFTISSINNGPRNPNSNTAIPGSESWETLKQDLSRRSSEKSYDPDGLYMSADPLGSDVWCVKKLKDFNTGGNLERDGSNLGFGDKNNSTISLVDEVSSPIDDIVDNAAAESVATSDYAYTYHVELKNWGAGLVEQKAVEKNLGPFYNLKEANDVAAMEVKTPLERYALRTDLDLAKGVERDRPGWAYSFEENATGLQKHKLLAGSFNAEAIVRRELAPRKKQTIPAAAFRTSSHIYIAHAIHRFYLTAQYIFDNDNDTRKATPELPDCEYVVLGTFTAPDLACKAASEHYIAMATGGLKPSRKDVIRMEVRAYLRGLEEGGYEDLFLKAVEFERVEEDEGDGGGEDRVGEMVKSALCTVWVEESRVVGPRN